MKAIFRLTREIKGRFGLMALAALLSAATIGSNLGLMMSSAFIIASAALHPSIAELQVAIVGVRFFGISRGIFRYLERLLSHEITFRLIRDLRIRFFRTLERTINRITGETHSAELLTNVTDNLSELENFFIKVLYPPFAAIVGILLSVLLFYFIHPLSAAILFSGMTITAILSGTTGFVLGVRSFARLSQTKSQNAVRIQEFLQGYDALYLWGRTDKWKSEIRGGLREYQHHTKKFHIVESLTGHLVNLGLVITVFCLLWILIPHVSDHGFTGISLTIVVIGAMAAFETVNLVPQAVINLVKMIAPAQEIFALEDHESTVQETKKEIDLTASPDIHFDNVRFSIGKQSILTGIDIDIPFGTQTAIVGPSGHGKTTLKKLIMGMQDQFKGDVTIAGIPVGQLGGDISKWLSSIEQSSFIFDRTYRDNIAINDDQVPDETIWRLIDKVRLRERIKEQTDGIYAYPGLEGEKISGGERQRLAVARALLHEKPVLICDEAAANLDRENEENIFKQIKLYARNKTLIWITHKLHFLDQFDQILVLVNGKIIQRGPFSDLIKTEGYLKTVWKLECGVFE